MPEGPTIVVFTKEIKPFEGKKVTECGGYRNPYAEEITGKTLKAVSTYGKYLILQFEKFFITVHFGMFGSFLVNKIKKVNPSFFMNFGEDSVNFYVVNVKRYDGMAVEHFDYQFDVFSPKFKDKTVISTLLEKFASKKIGDVLMNQQIFPGLGNVIRNQVLFLSKIHPESTVEKIPSKKLEELIKNIKDFSKKSVSLIEKKIWKKSSEVYQKEKFDQYDVKVYVSPAIKRKTFFVEELQKLYQ